MKKALVTGVILAVAVAVAAPAMAVDWSAAGQMYVRTAMYRNVVGMPFAVGSGGIDDTASWVDQRGRLALTARASKELYGVWYIEVDSTRWGEAAGDRNTAGTWTADRAAFEVKGLYIDFMVPQTPLDLRVGIQGHVVRSHIMWFNDGAGVTGRVKYENFNVHGGWAKVDEGQTAGANNANRDWVDDDEDIYYVDGSVGLNGWKLGGFGVYNDDQQLNAAGDAEHVYWIGAYADGKVNNFGFILDAIYNGGKIERRAETVANPDVDYGGYGLYGQVTYAMNAWTLGGGAEYFTGQDQDPTKTDEDKSFQEITGSEANTKSTAVVNGSCWGTGVCGTTIGIADPRMQGYWLARLFADYQAAPWLKLRGQMAYIGDTTDEGNTWGTALDATKASGLSDDDDVGWEFDLGAEIQIYKNLVYNIAFGYLMAGDALDVVDAAGANTSIDDPWVLVTALGYTF